MSMLCNSNGILSCTICYLQIKALKDLGLNVVKGVVTSEEGSKMRRKKFLVTRQYVNWPLCLFL